MAAKYSCHELANSRPLFLMVYSVVAVGILLSSFYVLSAIYSVNSSSSGSIVEFSEFFGGSRGERAPNSLSNTTRKTLKPMWEAPRKNGKMPPLKTFRLTKELMERRVENNVIIVTFGNYAFVDFILTWAKHLTDLGLPNFLVGAMDTKLLEALYWKGIPVFDMESQMSTVDAGWGSPTFHKIGRERAILLEVMLSFGYELLICDTDMVWLKNPLPYLARYPEADILTSSDQLAPTVVDDSLEIWQQAGAQYNIGILHWRPTESAKKLAKEWKDMILADDKIWDQNAFNDLIRKKLGPSVDDESGLVYAFDGNLKLGILPVSIFCSGHTYFVQAMYEHLRLEPYAAHTTYQYGGTEGKRHRLREGMLFYDPPEYYDAPGGFLSFKPSIPKALMLDGVHSIETHFSLVNYQIIQIRTAFAIATVLNRTMIMPPLWCRQDRFWFPHPGKIEGSMTRQPFLCPLDHVLEVNVMTEEQPEDNFGPRVDIREYSFLDNPVMSEKVKESFLEVTLCQQGTKDCQVSNNTSSFRRIKLPKHSNDETLKAVFSSFKDVKVIQFSSMQEAFGGFTDKEKEDKFRKRMNRYSGAWCCKDVVPGHIPYDMYWDEKPDWKPVPPQTTAG